MTLFFLSLLYFFCKAVYFGSTQSTNHGKKRDLKGLADEQTHVGDIHTPLISTEARELTELNDF